MGAPFKPERRRYLIDGIARLQRAGKTSKETAKELGISWSWVNHIALELKLPPFKGRTHAGKRFAWTQDMEALMRCCAECGMTRRETAYLLQKKLADVSAYARRLGIEFVHGDPWKLALRLTDEQMGRFYRWTPERVEILKQAYADGLDVMSIRKRLGDLTGKAPGKNSVIGKANRLGLSVAAPTGRPVTQPHIERIAGDRRPMSTQAAPPVSLPPLKFLQRRKVEVD